ncbi:hypothetical protein ACJJTC_006802 [Scirpophaga incertulas]
MSASLRIKFTPLLKSLNGDNLSNNNYLEILPHVAGVENLDKIHWKNENNCIEYTIPMTYKILLRKNKTVAKDEAIDKIYHSCVDLLNEHTDSATTVKSNDKERVLSDTFIFTKMSCELPENVVKEQHGKHEEEAIGSREAPQINKYSSTSHHNIAPHSQSLHSHKEISIRKVAVPYNENGSVAPRKSEVLESNVIASRSMTSVLEKSHKPTLTEANSAKKNKFNLRTTAQVMTMLTGFGTSQKLCASPFKTVGTKLNIYDFQYTNVETFNSVTLKLNNIKRNSIRNNKCKFSDIFGVKTDYKYNSSMNSNNNGRSRILVRARVAKFKQLMEIEMLPLKLMLGEIVNKCSTIGYPIRNYNDASILLKTINNCGNSCSPGCQSLETSGLGLERSDIRGG